MNGQQVVEQIAPYIVRIDTPSVFGTGFLFLYNSDKSWCGIATANHVVADADDWRQPIRIRDRNQTELAFLTERDRVIFSHWETDAAVILFPNAGLKFPEDLIPLLPTGQSISVGTDVGWLGFPAIDPATLCFFSGNISAQRTGGRSYWIDGVAINGVSGGPVLYMSDVDGLQIIGIVSAYQANRTVGGPLPGLLIAQDVSHFHDVLGTIQSFDEAKQKKEQLEQEQSPPPPPESSEQSAD
jgi:hypothetical protein